VNGETLASHGGSSLSQHYGHALASCTVIGSVPSRTQWTVSGAAQFAGTPSTPPVLLGALYYTNGASTPNSPAPVSNVVNLGAAAATPVSFSLSIDTRSLLPAVGDTIYIQMWEDANGNNQMDPAETQTFCFPAPGDAVFVAGCQFVFTGSGWYLGGTPIESARETGANVTGLDALN
jgi:hypothetical protein